MVPSPGKDGLMQKPWPLSLFLEGPIVSSFKGETINFELTSGDAASSESGDTGGVFLFS